MVYSMHKSTYANEKKLHTPGTMARFTGKASSIICLPDEKLKATVEKDGHVRIHIRGWSARIGDYSPPPQLALTCWVMEKTQDDRVSN